MPTPAPLDLEALSLDDLKRLVVELLLRVAAQEDEIRALREENAHLKSLPKRPNRFPSGPSWRLAGWTRLPSPTSAPRRPAARSARLAPGRARRRPPRSEPSRWRCRRARATRAMRPTPSRT